MWLTPAVLEWKASHTTSSQGDDKPRKRSYEVWAHGQQLLEKPVNELTRVDAITTLKRAVDHRIRLLKNIYDYRNIPLKGKPTGDLELLQYIGIIRPVMLQKLVEIRNLVEHEDAAPPDLEDCEVLSEFVWYFLRATDALARQSFRGFRFHAVDKNTGYSHHLSVSMGPRRQWIPEVIGFLRPNMLSEEPRDGWITLKVKKTETVAAQIAGLEEMGVRVGFFSDVSEQDLNDIYLEAQVRGPAECLHRLVLDHRFISV